MCSLLGEILTAFLQKDQKRNIYPSIGLIGTGRRHVLTKTEIFMHAYFVHLCLSFIYLSDKDMKAKTQCAHFVRHAVLFFSIRCRMHAIPSVRGSFCVTVWTVHSLLLALSFSLSVGCFFPSLVFWQEAPPIASCPLLLSVPQGDKLFINHFLFLYRYAFKKLFLIRLLSCISCICDLAAAEAPSCPPGYILQ